MADILQGFYDVCLAGAESEEKVIETESDRVSSEWWGEFVNTEDQFKIELSGKLMMLAEILRMSESIGDKVLVSIFALLVLVVTLK